MLINIHTSTYAHNTYISSVCRPGPGLARASAARAGEEGSGGGSRPGPGRARAWARPTEEMNYSTDMHICIIPYYPIKYCKNTTKILENPLGILLNPYGNRSNPKKRAWPARRSILTRRGGGWGHRVRMPSPTQTTKQQELLH